jgi:osmotically inducible lipoprotein OsmB
MRMMVVVGAGVLALAACGTMPGERAVSGAAIGAGVGLLGGGVGVVVGAILGGGAGYVIDPENLNLGEPVWK